VEFADAVYHVLDRAAINYDDDMGGEWGSPGHANGVTMQEGWITASYNALNQPMGMWCRTYGSNFLWFGYDPLGRCVKRWMGSATGNAPASNLATYYYYDGVDMIQEGSSALSAARIYVRGAGVDQIAASQVVTTGEWRYHHYDGQGNCILLTDTSGNIREQYDYDAFGLPYVYNVGGATLAASQWGNRFLFTGREWLSDLRIYDYRARQYQPELGRFLQPDPKEFAAGDYNLYRYCHNDPVNKSDPTGLVSWNAGAGLTGWGNGDWRANGSFNNDLVAAYQKIRAAISALFRDDKKAPQRSENGRLRVQAASVDVTHRTLGYHGADDIRGGYTPNPLETKGGVSVTSVQESPGNLSLTYHLQIQIRLNLSRGAGTRLWAKLREPDHANDFHNADARFQGAAGTLVGQRFNTEVAAAQGLMSAVNPVVQQVYDESRIWDDSGEHRPRDIKTLEPIGPDE